MSNASGEPGSSNGKRAMRAAQVIVVSSVMFTFISYWRTAAVVLCDLASTAYYIGGIVEQSVGPAAPWFILAVMLFSYAVRSVYIESCSLFVRGGVYRVVKEALGGFLAKLSVSALMFDYILTGPISGVSAGQYIMGLGVDVFSYATGTPVSPEVRDHWRAWGAVAIAMLITLYFFWQNLIGIHESSDKALKIMMATTVMAVVMLVWCGITLLLDGPRNSVPLLPDLAPKLSAVTHEPESPLGFLRGTALADQLAALRGNAWLSMIGLVGLFIAFGHSILAMSGEETLAQVYREVEAPKLKNFKKAAFIVFVYSLCLTAGISFLAVLLIPDDVRMSVYADNLIGGLAMSVSGPIQARFLLNGFVVVIGSTDFGRCREHGHYRRQWRAEPRGRRRRDARMVSQAAQAFRHDLPRSLLDPGPATGDHPGQPRRRVAAGRGLRLRRGVELRVQGPGNGGAAVPRSVATRIQSAAEFPRRQVRSAGRPEPDFFGAGDLGDHEPADQGSRHHLGAGLHVRVSGGVHGLASTITKNASKAQKHVHQEQFNRETQPEVSPGRPGLEEALYQAGGDPLDQQPVHAGKIAGRDRSADHRRRRDDGQDERRPPTPPPSNWTATTRS